MQRTKSKLLSILLSLVMLLSLLPTTALAAGNPDPTAVSVNGGISFSSSNLYYTNGASACSNNSTGWNAAYDPTTGTLTLDGYSGGSIRTGGTDADITVVLKGTNTINDGSLMNDMGGDITITSDCGGTLSITNTLSNSNPAIGIEAGLSGSYQTGNVTITGDAKVTINMTNNGTSTWEKAYGIYAKENITISGDASVDITCKTPYNTARFGDYCNGLYAKNNVTIDTSGTIKIDVKNAGGDDAYSFGIYPVGSAILTKVGKMEVQWKKDGSSGRAVYGSASFNSAEYDTNETTATNVDGTTYYITTYTPKVAATITSVSATVSQPVKGHPLDTTVNVGTATAYTATVMWKDVEENMTATGDAKPGKIYTALITLRAKEGEAFSSSLHNTTTPGGYSIEWLNSTELLLTKEFERTQVKGTTGIAIDNTTLTVAVPTAEPNMEQKAELPLTAKVIYDDGTDETVEAFWSFVDPKPEGVDIDKTTGKLTVTNKAAGGEVEVKAAYNGMTDTKTVTITKDTPVETAIVATAPTPATVAVPKSDTPNEIALPTAAVYDQYGMPMTTGTFTITYESVGTTPTGVTLASGSGKIKVERTAQAGEVKIVAKLGATLTSDPVIYNITRETSKVTSVRVDAPEYIMKVPKVTEPGATNQASQQFNAAKVLDQYGQEMTGQTVTWKVADDAGNLVTGVSIDATGNLTVTNKAPAITVYVTATCSGIVSNRSKVTINKEPAKATLVEICNQVGEAPETRLLIPAATFTNSENYSAKVYDQYGVHMPGEMVHWALDPATVAGVELDTTISSGNATLKVNSTATSGTTFKLKATTATSGTTGVKELDITVQKKTNVSSDINFNDGSLTYNGAGQKYEKAALDSSVTPGTGVKWTYTYTAGTGTLDTATGLPKTVGTYTVTATYEDSLNIGSKSATLTITPKTVDIPAPDTTKYTYDGTAKTYQIPASADYTVNHATQTNANETGYTVTVALTDVNNTIWSDGNTIVKHYTFKIMKATPTGEPAHTEITTSGKKLSDAGLTTTGGTFSVSGTVKWVDDTTGADLLDTTTVEANKLYKWVFTPSDSTNYEPINGTIKLWNKSTSSGGYYYAPTVPDMPMLYRGCTGDAVKTLQDKLNALGYNSGSVDGIFGAKTYAAVTAFQKANSLGVDGIVGKLTWGKLYGVSPAMPVETTTVVGRPTVSYGSRGDAVRKLQELLNALGYDCGSVDGIFGSKTKAAVLAFQKANGLGVDGIVGPLTWAKLG